MIVLIWGNLILSLFFTLFLSINIYSAPPSRGGSTSGTTETTVSTNRMNIKTLANENGLNYIDLFAGAGGLSEGFIQSGYRPVAHVEMNEHAAKTIETRIAYYYLKDNGKIKSYYDYEKGKIHYPHFVSIANCSSNFSTSGFC